MVRHALPPKKAKPPPLMMEKNTVQIFGCALLLSLYFVPGNKQMIINSRFLLGAVCLSLSISLLFLLPTIVTAAAYHV